jgi:hypothetical protein
MQVQWCKKLEMLAPLRFGAGIKGKLLEAMQWNATLLPLLEQNRCTVIWIGMVF